MNRHPASLSPTPPRTIASGSRCPNLGGSARARPCQCQYVEMNLRRLARDSNRSAHSLLDDYRLPPLGESHSIVTPEVWEMLVDIDLLQASIAGSRTWESGANGSALRAEIRTTCAALGGCAMRAGLESVSTRLAALGALLIEPDQ